MPLAATEIGAHTNSGTAAGNAVGVTAAPTRQSLDANATARLERLQWLLTRAPFAHGALTAIICSYVVQHPAVVLVLMLGFPALLIAQEAVDRRLLTPAGLSWAELQSRPGEAAVAIAGASAAPRHSLPHGMPSVTDVAPASTSTPAAA